MLGWKKKLWCFLSKTDTTKVQKFKEQCLFCCCFAFALVGLAVCYSNLLVCLLACYRSKQSRHGPPPTTTTTLLLSTSCLLERYICVGVCGCVCFPGFHSCWVDTTECMQVRTAHSGSQAAGSFVKAPNGYHFLWKPSTERKKEEEEEPPIICLLSHTHAYICACQVSESRWHPRHPGFQTGSLSEISTVITTSSSSSCENCHLKERKKETTIISSFSPTHKIIYPFIIIFFFFFCQVLWNLTIPQKKKLKIFQNTQFQQNHLRVVGTVDSFLWVSKSCLLSQLPYCKISSKSQWGAGC